MKTATFPTNTANASLLAKWANQMYRALLLFASIVFLYSAANALGSPSFQPTSALLPCDLVAISSTQIPNTIGGLYLLSSWPITPPLPASLWKLHSRSQFYLSPSMNMVFIDDNTTIPAETRSSISVSSLSSSESLNDITSEASSDTTTNAPSTPASVWTQGPETALIDTITGTTSNSVEASWRDARGDQLPAGGAIGILVATNTPFTLTRMEAEVTIDNTNAILNTIFQFCIFRGTNKFQLAMFEEPEFTAEYFASSTNLQLSQLDSNVWLLSLTLPPYAWGTDRVFSVRAIPLNDDSTFAKLCAVTTTTSNLPGVTAYKADVSGNLSSSTLPAVRVWRSIIPTQGPLSYQTTCSELEVSPAQGYQIGISSSLESPICWTIDRSGLGSTFRETSDGSGFFIAIPDTAE